MSQYPGPYGYGQWPAQVAPQQQPPQARRHGQPAYDGQYHDAQALEGQYAQSQASFAYNASIPGLGAGPAASPPAVPYPNPSNGWGYTYPNVGAASAVLGQDAQNHNPAPYHEQQLAAPPMSTSGPTPGGAHGAFPETVGEDAAEEGELSEGLFDDLYEPVGSTEVVPSVPANNPAEPVGTPTSGDISIVGAPETPFYEEEAEAEAEEGEALPETNGASPLYLTDDEDEEGEVPDQSPGPNVVVRERSGSYSPYLSPREIHLEDEVTDGAEPIDLLGRDPEDNTEDSITSGNARRAAVTKSLPQSQARPTKPNPVVPHASPAKTIDEAKKEAQKSILGLVSYGVRYQTYLDEGFDEKIIKSLFTDLGLNPSPGPVDKGSSKTGEEVTSKTVPQPQPAPAATTAISTNEKSEERKDRIARLLAEKASKSAASTPASQPATQPAQPSPKPAPEKAKSEKALLLQKKMDDLHRARQKRAEEQAARATSSSSEARASQSQMDVSSPDAAAAGVSATRDKSTKSPEAPRPPEAHAQHAGAGPSLTQLLRQPASQAGTAGRKRPVASDFVDYTTSVGPPKRPFGQHRQDSSLVIDVSDDSDEDVDMEMDSPEEGPSVLARRSPARKGPAIRDFPPLSDVAQRNYASSASSVPTPPGGQRNAARPTNTGYSKKLKEIDDLKRKIADLEQKQASKTPVRAQTPNRPDGPLQQGESPGPRTPRAASSGAAGKDSGPSMQLLSEAVAAKLPKLSDLRKAPGESKQERRVRISSIHLPKLDATLREKTSLLRLWEEKVHQLQAEVGDIIAAKARLADEAAALAGDSPSDSPPPAVVAPPEPETSALEPGNPDDEQADPEDAPTASRTAEDAPADETRNTESASEGEVEDTDAAGPEAITLESAEERASASERSHAADNMEVDESHDLAEGQTVDAAVTSTRSHVDGAELPDAGAAAEKLPSTVPTPADGSTSSDILEDNVELPDDAGEPAALPTHISDVRLEDMQAEEPTAQARRAGEVHVVFSRRAPISC